MRRTFHLRGLAEGLVGASSVEATSIADVFARHPALGQARDKLAIHGNTISGFAPCDG